MTSKRAVVAEAEVYGKIAFDNGIKCAPVLDQKVMGIVAELSTPDFHNSKLIRKVFNAWINGWTNANLATP
jgi:hypothetical protein